MTFPASSDSAASAPLVPSQVTKRRCVLVCQHRSCQRNGSEAVLAAFKGAVSQNIFVTGSDCTGQCSSGPTVRVMPDQTWYCRVTVEDVDAIVEHHLQGDRPVESLLHPRFHPRQGNFASQAQEQQSKDTFVE